MNLPKLTCFAHDHMTIAEFGLWSHLRELSSKYGYVYTFDDRAIAKRFSNASKSTVNALRQALAEKGFIVWQEPKRREGGKFVARPGRILSHREWAELHPGGCEALAQRRDSTCPDSTVAPVRPSTATCPESSHHLSDSNASPVQKTACHQSSGPDINMMGNSIPKHDVPNGMAAAVESEASLFLDSASPQRHLGAPVLPAGQVGPLGLKQMNGEWFTDTGVKVHPNALALLLGKEKTQ